VWTFQRLLYPTAPRESYYGAPGAAWPAPFSSVMDPLAVLAYVAATTHSVRLGVSVLIMPLYEPIVLAKQLATLDVLSGGRLDVGLGLGWSSDEWQASGTPMTRRGARADEFIRCLKAVWTDDPVEFQGEFYRVPRAHVAPRPVQRPHPPLLLGGYHPSVLRRAAMLCDGYTGGNIPLTELTETVARVREAATTARRDPTRFPIVCRGSFNLTTEPLGPRPACAVGFGAADPRGSRPLRRRRRHAGVPGAELPAGRADARRGAGPDGRARATLSAAARAAGRLRGPGPLVYQ
jgi:probable F420-dependent oxidoreductase